MNDLLLMVVVKREIMLKRTRRRYVILDIWPEFTERAYDGNDGRNAIELTNKLSRLYGIYDIATCYHQDPRRLYEEKPTYPRQCSAPVRASLRQRTSVDDRTSITTACQGKTKYNHRRTTVGTRDRRDVRLIGLLVE